MRAPSNQISPALARTRPETVRSVVLLPAPLAPIRVTMSPSSTSIETARSARTLW